MLYKTKQNRNKVNDRRVDFSLPIHLDIVFNKKTILTKPNLNFVL